MSLSKITSVSSGVYTREIDLTIVVKAAGTFAGGAIAITEKGPAFEITSSADFDERRFRLGELNPNFPSSYFAREFLEQAQNYKEVRVLGLEGYSDAKGYAILYDLLSLPPTAATLGSSPLIATMESIAAILKPRKTAFTSLPVVTSVEIQPSTGNVDPQDNEFDVVITFVAPLPDSSTTMTITCSLRPESKNFISKVFGEDPLDKALTGSVVSPLWVEFIIPSIKTRQFPDAAPLNNVLGTLKYYYPGGTAGSNNGEFVKLLPGEMTFDTTFTYPEIDLTSVSDSGTAITVTTAVNHGFVAGQTIILTGVTGPTALTGFINNKQFKTASVTLTTFELAPANTTSFSISDATNASPIVITTLGAHGLVDGDRVTISGITGNTAANGTFFAKFVASNKFSLYSDVTLVTPVAGNGAYTAGGSVQLATAVTTTQVLASTPSATDKVKLFYEPTWEAEVLSFDGVQFTTPITPWFVSDFNAQGITKRMFRVWSISDGEAGNTEIKIEIANVDPIANNGNGTFDLVVRQFSDRDDIGKVVVESFSNLTSDPASDNYWVRRIGDGENFPIKSRFIFLEFNEAETVAIDALPYGVEGIPNISGIAMPDITWTTKYNLNQPISKQTLGLANNNVNSFGFASRDHLSYKNITDEDAVKGRGFHLNPQAIDPASVTGLIVSVNFELASPTVYQTALAVAVTSVEKKKRSKYIVPFQGGFDGFNVYSTRTWGDTQSKDYEALKIAIEVFADNESLDADFSVLVTPDLNIGDHADAVSAVLEMVTNRGDALYIADFPYLLEANPQEVADMLQLDHPEMRSSFNAMYFPHVQIDDDVNKVNPFVPPSVIALGTVAATATNEQVWQPPAGSLRTITDHIIRTRRRMRLPDREILKKANINPITLFPGSGFEITESRTTQEALSALSFIHNRLLLGYAKKAINQTLRPMLQQLNITSGGLTQNAFLNTVTPIFDRIKKLNGLEDFKVVVLDNTDDRTTIQGRVEIVPLYPIERIIVDFVLNNSGATFSQ